MRKNVYVAALKYELCHCDGVEKICQIIGKPDAFLPESEAWCWFEKHENDMPAIKKLLKKLGY